MGTARIYREWPENTEELCSRPNFDNFHPCLPSSWIPCVCQDYLKPADRSIGLLRVQSIKGILEVTAMAWREAGAEEDHRRAAPIEVVAGSAQLEFRGEPERAGYMP
jgi:hypothetical protein